MPRPGWKRQPEGSRLTDHLCIGVLTRTFGRDLIDSILVATDRVQQRVRLLPSRVMIYYVLALSLYPQDSYEEVMRHLSEGLRWMDQFQSSWNVPSKVAIFKARLRLGAEPMKRLYEAVARPLAAVSRAESSRTQRSGYREAQSHRAVLDQDLSYLTPPLKSLRRIRLLPTSMIA